MPEVAVTTTEEVPGGVPGFCGGGGGFPPPQAINPPTSASAQSMRAADCHFRFFPAPSRMTPQMANKAEASIGAPRFGAGRADAVRAGRAVVLIVRVVLAADPFGVTDAGLNEQLEFAGSPLQLNVTALEKPCCGATLMLILTD